MRARLSPLRAVLLVATALLWLWFLLPVAGGVVSIANLSALVALGLLGAAILRWPRLRQRLGGLWEKRGGRVLLIFLAILLAAALLVTAVLSVRVISAMRQPEAEAETVIVLGCQVRGTQPSLLLAKRIEAAAGYLLAHPRAQCIVSGGQGSNEAISEAECMRQGLVSRGVEPERIYLEDRSTSTQENLAYSHALMQKAGLQEPVLVVSNNFHIYRALLLAQAEGLDAAGLPAPCSWYMLPTYVLREVMALVKCAVLP